VHRVRLSVWERDCHGSSVSTVMATRTVDSRDVLGRSKPVPSCELIRETRSYNDQREDDECRCGHAVDNHVTKQCYLESGCTARDVRNDRNSKVGWMLDGISFGLTINLLRKQSNQS